MQPLPETVNVDGLQWTMVPAHKLVGLWESVGTMQPGFPESDSVWEIGRTMAGHVFFLFTPLKHPDVTPYAGRTHIGGPVVYTLDMTDCFRDAVALIAETQTPEEAPDGRDDQDSA